MTIIVIVVVSGKTMERNKLVKNGLKFTINKDGTVDCVSNSSGNKYTITKNSCSCKGFIFRRNCRHFRTAKECGIIDKIKNQKISLVMFRKSPHIMEMRKKSVRYFLDKNNVSYTEKLVNRLESILTTEMTPEKFLKEAMKQ